MRQSDGEAFTPWCGGMPHLHLAQREDCVPAIPEVQFWTWPLGVTLPKLSAKLR
jgi:hypothetical protein